jgi:hypothetical protein
MNLHSNGIIIQYLKWRPIISLKANLCSPWYNNNHSLTMEIINTINLGVYLMLYICSVKTGIPTVIKLFSLHKFTPGFKWGSCWSILCFLCGVSEGKAVHVPHVTPSMLLFSTNPVSCHKWGTDRILITTNGPYPWSFVTQIFRSG